jgi:hypothetical protein
LTESEQTQHVVIVDLDQLPDARALANAHGVEVEQVPRLGIEPVATVTLVLMGTAAAVGTVVHVLEQRRGGQVIDLRPEAPKAFYRTPDVVYGTVVIVSKDGTVTVEVKEPDGMFGKVVSGLSELLAGGDESVAQITQAVTTKFGSDVEVDTVRSPRRGGES